MSGSRAEKDAYAKAGVSIDAGNALVERIKPMAAATARVGTKAGLGGFGAFFDIKACGYKDPLIVSTNDGVGTKLKIAIETNRHDGIGVDCVAMCVNDLVVSGAEPLFFLDYFATGKLEVGVAEKVIAGVAKGCKESNCALVGGETAELPGLYAEGDYDLAGFSVGAVERDGVITGEKIREGDVVLGLFSSGPHSNGYSLIRKIVKDRELSYSAKAPFANGIDIAEALLLPTKLYVRPLLALAKQCEIKGVAHITGGGLLENIPRVLPKGVGVDIDGAGWHIPEVFRWIAREGKVPPEDMVRTFNCGIGMAVVISGSEMGVAEDVMKNFGIACSEIGTVEKRAEGDAIMQFSDMDFR
jgi:phosphoribosylformylglycinamidine cyclo-ligase